MNALYRAARTDPDAFATFSASLPLVATETGGFAVCQDVRPWNGRALTEREVVGCFYAAAWSLALENAAMAAQTAHEWLSEHAA